MRIIVEEREELEIELEKWKNKRVFVEVLTDLYFEGDITLICVEI